jgi:hypothetical protein
VSALTARPLPECALCEAPTRRESYDRNGGLCSECAHTLVLATARRARLVTSRRRRT